MEAMACGLPCVATRVGGVPEVVEHGVTGLLGEAGDPEVLGAHLRQLSFEPELRQHFGIAGRRRVETLFDASDMFQRFGALYRRMTGRALGPDATLNTG
jgi:glycosyltransferase involved in cell wall biosynthesis